MKSTYHFNPETGVHGICSASKRDCPYVHGSSIDEAKKNYEKVMEDQNLTFSSFTKNSKSPSLSPSDKHLRRTPLKELEPQDLAKVILVEAKDSGMNVEKIHKSIELATVLHEGQTRGPRWQNGVLKEKVPYIEHPLRNSLRLMRLGVQDQNIVIASVLHDTVEDGSKAYSQKFLGQTLEENDAREVLSNHIEGSYGQEVKNIVQAVTNDYVPVKEVQAMSMEDRRKVYRDHVDHNIKNNVGAYMVKLSDFIDNATGLYHNDMPGKEKAVLKRALKYKPVVQIFRSRMEHLNLPLSNENLQVVLGQLDRTEVRLATLIEKYN